MQTELGEYNFTLILAARLWKRARNKQISEAHISRANALFVALLLLLGNKCALCSSTFEMAIDHVDGRDWDPAKVNRYTRVRRYWKEHRAGVRLRVLCRKCNGGYNPSKYR